MGKGNKNFLFIDESGDPGRPFKVDKRGAPILDKNGNKIPTGASKYYIITVLPISSRMVFALEEEVLKTKMRSGYKGELKSNLISLKLYEALLKVVVKFGLKVHYRNVNKLTYKGKFAADPSRKPYFSNLFDTYNVVKTIRLTCEKEKLQDCEVVIDRTERRASGGGYNFDEFNEYLRKRVNNTKIRRVDHIVHVDSEYVNLMQLSDLISGAIRDYTTGKNKSLKAVIAKQLYKVY